MMVHWNTWINIVRRGGIRTQFKPSYVSMPPKASLLLFYEISRIRQKPYRPMIYLLWTSMATPQ